MSIRIQLTPEEIADVRSLLLSEALTFENCPNLMEDDNPVRTVFSESLVEEENFLQTPGIFSKFLDNYEFEMPKEKEVFQTTDVVNIPVNLHQKNGCTAFFMMSIYKHHEDSAEWQIAYSGLAEINEYLI